MICKGAPKGVPLKLACSHKHFQGVPSDGYRSRRYSYLLELIISCREHTHRF